MPYIKAKLPDGSLTERRKRLEPFIQALASELKSMKDCSHSLINAGDLNYVVTMLILSSEPKNYAACNEMYGMLGCCKAEYYRRYVAPYEDLKALDNGDVYPEF